MKERGVSWPAARMVPWEGSMTTMRAMSSTKDELVLGSLVLGNTAVA